MGDPPCDRAYCPACDLQVTVVDEACPECGARLPTGTLTAAPMPGPTPAPRDGNMFAGTLSSPPRPADPDVFR